MILVKNAEGNYLTKKSLTTDFTFTNNRNFAYVFDSKAEALATLKYLDVEVIIEEEDDNVHTMGN